MNNQYHCLIFHTAKSVSIRSSGASRIAHYLREHGWDAEVIDWALIWNLEQLQLLAKSRITDATKFVGISSTFSHIWSDHFEEFLIWLKQEYPHVKIISGGQQELAINSSSIDYYIHGFGEYALFDLLKYLFSNGNRPKFEILTNGKKVINATLSYPAYPMSSYMIKYEDRDFIVPGETLGIELSRGCKFSCKFCNYPVLGVKGDYSRDADDFVEQINNAYDRFGITDYIISDETLNDRTEKIAKFADAVQTLSFVPWFTAYVRADLLISRPRDREELLRMNVVNHLYGIESFNHTATKSIGKGMHPDKIKSGLIDVRKYFESKTDYYRALLSFIIGLPTETIDSIEEARQWVRENWAGQSFHSNKLWIPNQERDNKSKLSFEYKEYGYTEMIGVKETPNNTNQDIIIPEMQWQNENMNIEIASRIQADWDYEKSSINSIFKTGFECLNDPRLHELSLDERYNMTQHQWSQYIKTKYGVVDNYITKKLNL